MSLPKLEVTDSDYLNLQKVITIRIVESEKQLIQKAAHIEGISMNQYCIKVLMSAAQATIKNESYKQNLSATGGGDKLKVVDVGNEQ